MIRDEKYLYKLLEKHGFNMLSSIGDGVRVYINTAEILEKLNNYESVDSDISSCILEHTVYYTTFKIKGTNSIHTLFNRDIAVHNKICDIINIQQEVDKLDKELHNKEVKRKINKI